jgi:hypothetical protein
MINKAFGWTFSLKVGQTNALVPPYLDAYFIKDGSPYRERRIIELPPANPTSYTASGDRDLEIFIATHGSVIHVALKSEGKIRWVTLRYKHTGTLAHAAEAPPECDLCAYTDGAGGWVKCSRCQYCMHARCVDRLTFQVCPGCRAPL